MTRLFDPIQLGAITLNNRIVMAPLTRNRALPGEVPGPMTVEYYRQRATAGLIISEGAQISPTAQGYLNTPGIFTSEQVAAWKKVTDAVHQEGGHMYVQLWHVGRISHVSLLPKGASPVSSTDRAANGMTYTREGFVPVSIPRRLTDEEIPGLIDDYRQAAECALEAGFDGVEIHAANTYLIEQFLRDSVNDRVGPYGGSIPNRARLLLDITARISTAIGADRIGVRLSPMTSFNGTPPDSDPQSLHAYVVEKLSQFSLAYLHVIEGETGGDRHPNNLKPFDYEALHRLTHRPWMVNNGYDRKLAIDSVESGKADLVAFGRAFIANPDLVKRLRDNLPLNEVQFDKLYGGGAEGYIDYPFAGESV